MSEITWMALIDLLNFVACGPLCLLIILLAEL